MFELEVVRGVHDLQELWSAPASAPVVTLTSAVDGSPLPLTTKLSVYRTDDSLFVLFTAEDDSIVATHLERDAPLYEEDAFEVFLAPQKLERYYEFEVSPMGTLFDALVDSPQRERGSMSVDRQWNCAGFWGAVRAARRAESLALSVIVKIPFAGLGVEPPRSGDTWWANFYRIDRSRNGDTFAAWSPTLKSPADFHVPERFGRLRFQ